MSMFSSARVKRALLSLCVLFPMLAFGSSNNHDARVLWLTLPGSVLKVSPMDGSAALQLAGLKHPGALAVEGDNDTVWVYGQKAITGYDHLGNTLITVNLPHNFHGGSPSGMAVDNTAGNIWIAIQKDLYRLNMGGDLQADIALAGNATGASLDPSQSKLWVAEQTGIEVFDASGNRVLNIAQSNTNPPTALAYDAGLKQTWVLYSSGIVRYDASGNQIISVVLAADLGNFVAPDGQGGAWVGGQQNLARLDTTGTAQFVIQPFAGLSGGNALGLVSDAVDHSAWMANSLHLRHFDTSGSFLLEAVLPVGPGNGNGMQQLGYFVDTTPPTVSITAPTSGLWTNKNQLPITLSYSDDTGVDPASIQITSNGGKLAVTCQANADDSGASCTPNSPLPDGGYSLSVTVADYAGNVSKPASVSFNVLTVPPTITVTSPTSPYTNQPNFTVTGSVNQPGTLTINDANVPMAADGSFSDTVTLTQGDNTLTFVATDLADNITTVSKTLNLNTIPPIPVANGDINVTGPTNGAVTVTGKAGSVAPNVSVTITDTKTGQSVTVTSDSAGAFTANLAAGSNDSLQITEQDKWGNVTTDPNQIAISNLPPDPASVAPPLSTTGFTSFADQTSFLYSGANPIQTGVAAGALDPATVSVIRGKVMDVNGNALPGVAITVFAHPEFGQTLSRADGYFDIAVNGGGTVTLDYSLKGYIPAQRKVRVPWNAYTSVDTDVFLIKPDPKVTPVNFGATVAQIAQGSVVTDDRGTRQASVYFPAGTTASMLMPDGSTQQLSGGSFRATEFTVGTTGGQTMPADVPTGSDYTYAVDLSFDEAAAAGAQSVTFNQPVPVYLNNFLNVPVGYAVPNYYLDRGRGDWDTSGSGDVIKVLSLDSQGNAVLDVDGTGNPASVTELTQLGITTAELGQIAQQFKVGSTFWRFGLTHFTTYDFNFGYEDPDVVANPQTPPKKPPCPDHNKGCDISAEYQTLGEDVAVTGTPFVLHYDSSRQPGYTPDNVLHLQVTGPTIPTNLAGIVIRVDMGGRVYNRMVTAFRPNQVEDFIWDGHDRYGRVVYGQTGAAVHVGYVFNPVHYFVIPTFPAARLVSVVIGAANVATHPAWKAVFTSIGSAATPPQGGASGINGWSLSVHHALDPATRTVYLGNGETRLGSSITTVVRKITGCCGYLPRPASLTYASPDAITIASNGDIYFDGTVEEDGYTYLYGIFKIDHATTTVTQVFDYHGSMAAMAAAQDGSIYYVTYTTISNRQQIFRWRPDGTNTLVAGIGTPGCPTGGNCSQGGPATQALLERIPKLSVGPDGTLFFLKTADWDGTTCVAEIKTDGTWTCITPVYDNWVNALAAAPDGSVYFGGDWSYRIFQWKPDHSITPVVGNGYSNGLGDGGPATQAALSWPSDVYVAADGTLYINDSGRIRRVGHDGIITTIAGGGYNTNYPVPAIGAGGLWQAGGAIAPDGTLKFVSYYSTGILSVEPAVPGAAPILGSSTLTGYVIPSSDGTQLYTFDRSGRHLQTIDAITKAAIYTFGYDSIGNFVSITDANNRVTTINRDATGNATSIVSPDGQVTKLTSDSNGYLNSVTDPAGDTYNLVTRPDGLLTSFTDPNGKPDSYSYDLLGQLVQNQNAVGGGLTLVRTETLPNFSVIKTSASGLTQSYQALNNTDGTQTLLVKAPDGTLNTSQMNRDADSEVDTAADGTVTTVQFGADPRFGADVQLPVSESIKTPSGLIRTTTMTRSAPLSNAADLFSFTSLTDTVTRNGNSYVSQFVPSTKTWTSTTPMGRTSTTVVDAVGRPVSVRIGNLAPIAYGYDAAGHVQSITKGSGASARTTYYAYYANGPARGYLQSVTDSLGRTESYQYDSVGRMTTQTQPDGEQVQFGYDANGRLSSVTPPSRAAYGFDHDGIGETQDYVAPSVSGVTSTVTQYTRDLDGRITEIARPDGQAVGFGYNAGGQLNTISTPTGIYAYTYVPGKDQVQSITAPSSETLGYTWDGFLNTGVTWSGPIVGNVTRTFDSNFHVTAIGVNGSSVNYTYDNDGFVISAGTEALSRDAVNAFITGTSIGVVTTAKTYDNFGSPQSEVAKASGTTLYSAAYTRNGIGRISGKSESIGGVSHSYSYDYDQQGRLDAISADGVETTYGYDHNGNRTSVNGTTIATYDGQDRLLSYGTNSYAYTANGELLTKTDGSGTTGYTYDALENLTDVTLSNNSKIHYVIDGQNRRVAKQVNGVTTQGFLYQDQLNPVAELDGSGNVVQRYVYGSHVNVPDYIIQGSNTYRVIADQLGSPRLIVDTSAGTVIEQIDYDVFGNVTNDTNPGFQPFGFAGGLYDQDTKFVRFGARDYDPSTGRWNQKDPMSFYGGDTNLYQYVLADPVNSTDSTGLCKCGADSFPHSWDSVIEQDVDAYNQEYGYSPSDPEYLDPNLIKAQIMTESGGDLAAYNSDPSQVNNSGDWVPEKANYGLQKGVAPGGDGIAAGIAWMAYKAYRYDSSGNDAGFRGWPAALKRYNGGGDPHYLEKVMRYLQMLQSPDCQPKGATQ